MFKKVSLVFILILLSNFSYGGTLRCGGKVEYVGMSGGKLENNRIIVQLSSMNRSVAICSPEKNWEVAGSYVTGPEMCKSLLSMLMAAKATGSEVIKSGVVFDGPDVPEDCNSWESHSSANIRYLSY